MPNYLTIVALTQKKGRGISTGYYSTKVTEVL
jgi:hypothetical protein